MRKSFLDVVQSPEFELAIASLECMDFLATNLVELGVLVNEKLPLTHHLSEHAWKQFVFDTALPEVKVTDAYIKNRHKLGLLKIGAKKTLIKTVLEEETNFLKQKGSEILLKIRFPNIAVENQDTSIQSDSGISILPAPPPNLPPPPDAEKAIQDAENFFIEE